MICVTGAGGTVGSEVVRQLQAAGVPFRAAYHSPEKAAAARARGIDAVVIDYARPETLEQALRGADRLFLLGPSDPDQTELELNAVDAARKANVKHIVYLSVWGAEEEAFDFARVHRPVETAIQASGLAWTMLRPNNFMQNVVTYMGDSIRSQGAMYSATSGARISHVDVRDIAAVAVKALTESGHESKAYTLSGPEALTYTEMAAQLSRAMGRPVSHVDLPPADLKAGMLAMGAPEPMAAMLIDLERYFSEDQASRVTRDIENVTGHGARRFAESADDFAARLQSDAP